VVIPRRVYEQIGGYCPALPYTADWELYFRVGLAGSVITLTEPLSGYREHSANFTSRAMRTGQNIREAIATVERCVPVLPRSTQQSIGAEKYYWVTKMAFQNALRCAGKRQWQAALSQTRWAIRLLRHIHPRWCVLSAKLLFMGGSV
jgi:hypothetical protein